MRPETLSEAWRALELTCGAAHANRARYVTWSGQFISNLDGRALLLHQLRSGKFIFSLNHLRNICYD